MTSDLLASLTGGEWTKYHDEPWYLQVYNVSVHRGFAPIQDCNYNPAVKHNVCTGGHRTLTNLKSVGRSSGTFMEGVFGGQCTENAVVGSWYGFPAEGECAPHQNVGDGCTWKMEDFKAVANECIADLCLDKYKQEKSPYTLTQACLQQAIAECPDVKGKREPTCFTLLPAPDVHV